MTCPFVNPTSGYRTLSRLVSLRVRFSIWTSTSVLLATFAHHLTRRLVRAQALERWGAQLARLGPLDELEFPHQLGLHEMRALRRCAAIKRARFALQRFQQLAELLEHLVSEAGADLARVHELPLVVIAHQQCTGISAPLALAVEPARDHELLAHAVLDLLPDAAALARLVRRVEPLGHDALEPRLAARLEHLRPASLFERRRLPRRAFQLQRLELLPPVDVGLFQQRVPVLPHDVEQHVGDRDLFHLAADLRLGGEAHALLDLLEARAALLTQRHDLAVQDYLHRSQRPAHGVHLGVSRCDVFPAAAQQSNRAAIDVGLGPDSVPFELESPRLVRRWWFLHELGVHPLDALGHRLALGIIWRVHAVDHPVLAVGPKQDVSTLELFAVEDDHDFAVGPVLDVVSAAVPDQNLARAVVAGRDVAMKVDVVERVVLHVDREVIGLRVHGNALRDRPGDEHAIVLEPEVPVQPPRVVLLDDEPRF